MQKVGVKMKKCFLIVAALLCLSSCAHHISEAKILVAGKSLQSQLTDSDAVYVVRDSFDLQGSEVSIPSDCILEFAGGNIRNGLVKFNNTKIQGYASFRQCSYSGTISNDEVELAWFDFADGGSKTWRTLTYNTYESATLQQIIDCCKNGACLNVDKIYGIKKPVTVTKRLYMKGADRSEGIYADRIVQNMEYGFMNCDGLTSLFIVEEGGDLSVQGLSFVGYTNLYMGGQLWEKCYSNGVALASPVQICGIDCRSGGRISEVHDSSFVAFTYGIRCDGGSLGYIRNSYFSICRFGFWARNTSNFECRGCRFNSNELNFHFYEKNLNYVGDKSNWEPLKETDAEQIARMGGGLYLENCEDVEINNSRFEFNFIQAIINGSAKDVTIHNCIMDTATLCHVAVINLGNDSVRSRARAIDNFTLSSCTLARGARCDIANQPSVPGFGIFYLADIGDRGASITFKNIIVSDDMEVDKSIDAHYEDVVFDIFNTSSTNPCVLNIEGNSFYSSEATRIFNIVEGSVGSFRVNDYGNDYGDKTLKSGASSVLTLVEG